jgi:hypothetical protein
MHPRRASWLTLAAVLVAAGIAIACLLVFVDDGPDGGSSGQRSARDVAAGFAAALDAHSSSRARSLTCASARDDVMDDVDDLIDGVTAASLATTVTVRGEHASATLSITVHQHYVLPAPSGGVQSREATPTFAGRLELTRQRAGWCVSDLDAAEPVY